MVCWLFTADSCYIVIVNSPARRPIKILSFLKHFEVLTRLWLGQKCDMYLCLYCCFGGVLVEGLDYYQNSIFPTNQQINLSACCFMWVDTQTSKSCWSRFNQVYQTLLLNKAELMVSKMWEMLNQKHLYMLINRGVCKWSTSCVLALHRLTYINSKNTIQTCAN